MKTTFTLILLAFMCVQAIAESSYSGAAGVKTIGSSDSLNTRYYLKPFASLTMGYSAIAITADYNFWYGYTITDSLFNEKKINIQDGGGTIVAAPSDMFSVSGSYHYLMGESSYTAHRFGGEAELSFDNFSISAGYDGKKYEYTYNDKVEAFIHTVSIGPDFDLSDSLSLDVTYDLIYSDFTSYGYSITSHSLRTGLTGLISKSFIMMGGITAGYDSNDMFSGGLDAAVIWKLWDHVRLSASYALTAKILTSSTTTSGMKGSATLLAGGGGSGGSSTSDGVSSTEVDYSHSVIVSASLYF